MKNIIQTTEAPRAIGPYSQAVVAGPFLYASGQIPIDPATGAFVSGEIAEQTEQVMKNLSSVLAAANCSFADVVKTTVFLKDMGSFAGMNEVYGRYFESNPPARATVEVSGLPKGALVEIELVALVPQE